jgi:hypothetical protein
MNHQSPREELPDLSDETIARIENAVFAEVSDRRAPHPAPSVRSHARRRRWLTGVGIAAAFALGVLVTPPILDAVDSGTAASTADGVTSGQPIPGVMPLDQSVELDRSAAQDASAESAPLVTGDTAVEGRDIIATAQATLEVDDIADAADAIAELAEEHEGYVEGTEIGRSTAVDGSSTPATEASGFGWISIRVPSADLTDVIAALDASGEVLSSSISRQDVTDVAVDLRARIEATEASVQRLTELMAQSGTVSELIEAEIALTERQAELESYRQQLASIDDQVAMSSLHVQLTRTATTAAADPAGFGDGLLAGWNGLVVSLNALVISVGFLLPWIGIAAVIGLIVWGVRRIRRSRREARSVEAPATEAPATED